MSPEPRIDLNAPVADRVAKTTCYMCACRCGIDVHLNDVPGGRAEVRYIEGNRDHPVNRGVICGKGASGIMQHNSPARLRAPMKRVGPRGSGEFEEISWDEALRLATEWMGEVRRRDPKRLAFFTGRDQSQSLTGFWAMKFGTPNFAAHGGFCSVNMAAGGLYTFGGSFWEFGDPDWDRTKYFLLFGVAEDHASNPIKIGIGKLKARGAKVVSVNPVRTGYNAVADEWVGVRPGTDGLFVGALIHELFRTRQIDLDYLIRYTNAPWLVIDAPGTAEDGLFARDGDGNPLAWSRDAGSPVSGKSGDLSVSLTGARTLPDGRRARPVFELMAERFLGEEYSPEAVAAETGIPADQIRRIAAEMAHVAFREEIVLDRPWIDAWGRRHEKMIGRPVSMHAMRGISAHSNGFQTCRTLHVLQILLGSIDCPGGFRYKPPYPKQTPPNLLPHGLPEEIRPEMPLGGPHLGFPHGPHHLLIDAEGNPSRLDKGFSWDAPLSAHGLMHMVLNNAATRDPYGIDVLFLYMANMAWNSSMNVKGTLEALTAKDGNGDYVIPKIIYSDAYYSETVPYADLILPDTTYLERWDCISLLDRPISEPDMVADAIRVPVVPPDRDVRPFQDVLIDLGARLGLPGFVKEDGSAAFPGGYPDYMVNHERKPGIGPLAGWRGDGTEFGVGAPNPDQLDRYAANGAWSAAHIAPEHAYFKHANRGYLDWGIAKGIRLSPEPTIFQLYSEPLQRFRLAARGHGERQPPDHARDRIERHFDPLPFWYPPFEGEMIDGGAYPLHAITQRPMHMYHSWGSQNAWLRQITAANRLYIHRDLGARIGAMDDDWVWISSHLGRVKCQVRLMEGVNPHTVWTWNAIGKRKGAWNLSKDAPEATEGFLLNHLISELLPKGGGGYRYSNSDPITGQAAWFDLRVSIEKAEAGGESEPRFEPLGRGGLPDAPNRIAYGAKLGEPAE
ncbi:molybdopterin oxidoreductase family protein [Roseibacterium sp. SDUM158016]|uniref:molybdopterin oxidoreductase family protein n=1 Tax=Roseicyclus sediminis TaxID=2980997 RepID=UPI0021D2A8C6|nr:molybdopterin oxidoreductase family protein [Roseibacterium sp. SDUM158016]MCU4653062.1 molybdopterin oxidoreductase family protein [Roseibacterium sp. SDUM158016]